MTGLQQVARSVVANRRLSRVVAAWFLWSITMHGVWIAVLAYAFGRGGATEAGVAAVVEVVPPALLAPLLAPLADRRSPSTLLIGGFALQTAGMALVAACMYSDAPPVVTYGLAVLVWVGVATTRPALATLTPALARDVEQLSAANVAYGWLDSVGLVIGSLVTAAGLALASAGFVLAVSAVLGLGQVALVHGVRVASIGGAGGSGGAAAGFAVLRTDRRVRLLVGLITAAYVVIGALDVVFVLVTFSVLRVDAGWVGFLSAGFGVGGVLAGVVTATLVGRALGVPIALAGLTLAAAVALTATSSVAAITLVLFVVAGAGKAVLLVATQTLLQRAVPAELVGRIFGVVEGLLSLGLAVGSLLVPVLVALGGDTAALLGVAAVLPLAGLAGGRAMFALDSGATVPVVEIALLRSLRHFSVLPAAALAGLAGSLEPVALADGAELMRQGEPGDRFYAVADGQVAIWIDGQRVATRGRGTGVGEIALLRRSVRSATVVADGPVRLYALAGSAFLSAVTGHTPTLQSATAAAEAYPDGAGRA